MPIVKSPAAGSRIRLAVALVLAATLALTAGRSGDARGAASLAIAWNWLGCVGAAPPCVRTTGMSFPKWLAVTGDERSVYVSAQNGDAVVVLARDPATGAVQQPAGPTGCVTDDGAASGAACTSTPGLDSPQGLAVSPDGTDVYVTANVSNAITVLGRDAGTGALHAVQCLSDSANRDPGCDPASGLDGASHVAVSPDGRNVYVAAVDSQALTVYRRDATTGRLTQTGCFVDASVTTAGCGRAPGLKQAFAVTLDPAGENVYVAARASSAVSTFKRDGGSGALTPMGCIGGDRGYRQDPACAPAIAMQYIQFVVSSPDGKQLYASATDSHAIGVFSRGPDGALTQLAMPDGCVQDIGYEPATSCRPTTGLALPLGVTFAPDGRDVYAAEFGYGTLSGYTRDPNTGALAQVAGCLGSDPRCEQRDTLQRAGSIALVGDQLLVTAAAADAVNILRPTRVEVTPTPTPKATPTPTATPEPFEKRPLRLSVKISSGQSLRRALRRGLLLSLVCSRACRVSASLTISRAAAERLRLPYRGRSRVAIARLRADLPANRSVSARVKFTARARVRLRRVSRIAVRLRVGATADGTVRTRTRRIVLRGR